MKTYQFFGNILQYKTKKRKNVFKSLLVKIRVESKNHFKSNLAIILFTFFYKKVRWYKYVPYSTQTIL